MTRASSRGWATEEHVLAILRVVIVLGIVLNVAIGPARPAHACSCYRVPLADRLVQLETLEVDHVVVVATPVGFREGMGTRLLRRPAFWTFDVERVFGGHIAKRVEVRADVAGASCGLDDLTGVPHTFVLRDQDGWETDLCEARPAGEAHTLGQGVAPDPGVEPAGARWPLALLVATALAAAGAAVGVVLKVRPRH